MLGLCCLAIAKIASLPGSLIHSSSWLAHVLLSSLNRQKKLFCVRIFHEISDESTSILVGLERREAKTTSLMRIWIHCGSEGIMGGVLWLAMEYYVTFLYFFFLFSIFLSCNRLIANQLQGFFID